TYCICLNGSASCSRNTCYVLWHFLKSLLYLLLILQQGKGSLTNFKQISEGDGLSKSQY
ncbi:unnamed protein product, partial [Bubo scandiacus]